MSVPAAPVVAAGSGPGSAWSDAERATLAQCWLHETARQISAKLGRSRSAVLSRARQMNLPSKSAPGITLVAPIAPVAPIVPVAAPAPVVAARPAPPAVSAPVVVTPVKRLRPAPQRPLPVSVASWLQSPDTVAARFADHPVAARLAPLTAQDCRYVFGDPNDPLAPVPFRYCGDPVRDEKTSYCAAHAALCFAGRAPVARLPGVRGVAAGRAF